jgi:hypothetical protein
MGGEDLLLEMDYDARSPGRHVSVVLNIYNESGAPVTAAHTSLTRPDLPPLARSGTLRCRLRRVPLTTGSYRVAIALQIDGETADYLPRAASLEVAASVFYATGKAVDSRKAAFLLDHEWEHLPQSPPATAPAGVEHVGG